MMAFSLFPQEIQRGSCLPWDATRTER